jgi:hypothetical protein
MVEVFESRLLERIFGLKIEEGKEITLKFQSDKPHNLKLLSNIDKLVKQRRLFSVPPLKS